jgi:hypothetical protein
MDNSLLKISKEEVENKYESIEYLLKGFDFRAKKDRSNSNLNVTGVDTSSIGRRRNTVVGLSSYGRNEKVSLVNTITKINEKSFILDDKESFILYTIKNALAISRAVHDYYTKSSGLGLLLENSKTLLESQKVEKNEKIQAGSLIMLYVASNYISYSISKNYTDLQENLDLMVEDEILLDKSDEALKSFLYELDLNISMNSNDSLKLLSVVNVYVNKLMSELLIKSENMLNLVSFKDSSYNIEGFDFHVNGFNKENSIKSEELIMTFKKPEEIVGNAIAKYQALKLSKMLMAYDFDKKLNPFVDLGGFVFTFMGDGNPGTGKTILIQMMAGMLNDYCKVAKYPFRYENLNTDAIDSYQGKSAQNTKNFVNSIIDDKVIGFGTIDDIDQIAGKRGDKNSSSGQQEITGALMEAFAGANTVVRGNCTFGMFSNYPENVDDALRQRAGARFLIDGPQTLEDYIDIFAILIGNNHNLNVGDIDLFATQNIKKAVSKGYEKHNFPEDDKLLKIYKDIISTRGEIKTISDIGFYLKQIQQLDDRFTGRAIKNVTDSIKVRSNDIELPDEWFENPELFLWKPYENKMDMIKEMIQPITSDMIIQEINRYADSELRYSNKSDNSEIEKMVRHFHLQEEAKKIYNKKYN